MPFHLPTGRFRDPRLSGALLTGIESVGQVDPHAVVDAWPLAGLFNTTTRGPAPPALPALIYSAPGGVALQWVNPLAIALHAVHSDPLDCYRVVPLQWGNALCLATRRRLPVNCAPGHRGPLCVRHRHTSYTCRFTARPGPYNRTRSPCTATGLGPQHATELPAPVTGPPLTGCAPYLGVMSHMRRTLTKCLRRPAWVGCVGLPFHCLAYKNRPRCDTAVFHSYYLAIFDTLLCRSLFSSFLLCC